MNELETNEKMDAEAVHSKVLRAGRRTYFFDVRETKAGDYYLTITESKKNTNEDGSFFYKKHKIYLYKEDFSDFNDLLNETTQFVLENKGKEVISERHQKNFEMSNENSLNGDINEKTAVNSFTNLSFEDI